MTEDSRNAQAHVRSLSTGLAALSEGLRQSMIRADIAAAQANLQRQRIALLTLELAEAGLLGRLADDLVVNADTRNTVLDARIVVLGARIVVLEAEVARGVRPAG